MKRSKFKQSNDKTGTAYINHTENTIIMKFRLNLWDMLKLLVGVPLWVGTNINGQVRHLKPTIRKTAFIKDKGEI
jgi:hypothetical protein